MCLNIFPENEHTVMGYKVAPRVALTLPSGSLWPHGRVRATKGPPYSITRYVMSVCVVKGFYPVSAVSANVRKCPQVL